MFKKLLVAFGALLCISTLSFATDLLAFYTNGKLTENSPGVKVLSLDEKKQVKGGYVFKYESFKNKSTFESEVHMILGLSPQEANYIRSGKGICTVGQSSCSNPSLDRLVAYKQITYDSLSFFPMYIVKRKIQYSRYGQAFVVFSYGVGAMGLNGNKYKFNSTSNHLLLNNNMVMKEVRAKYQSYIESAMGGYNPRVF
ncbi:MAG TPA: hypothetical protein K8V51_04320 [Campylobacter avium]|uniref:hypothetical protein n=1 Tax=Campylobacter avium TaxID=522485 RepID=UPI001D73E6E0|nr:hypothetical protein [Campylobacter avium]HJE66272.1 hypothetical protein [Campylobacter avium]